MNLRRKRRRNSRKRHQTVRTNPVFVPIERRKIRFGKRFDRYGRFKPVKIKDFIQRSTRRTRNLSHTLNTTPKFKPYPLARFQKMFGKSSRNESIVHCEHNKKVRRRIAFISGAAGKGRRTEPKQRREC